MPTIIYDRHLIAAGGATTATSPLSAGGYAMDVAALPDGRILVVRDGASVNADGSGIGGFFLDSTGQPVAGSGFAVSQFALGAQSAPQLAVLADGGFAVVWVSQGQDGFGGGIYGRLFDAAGAPRGAEFQISDDLPADQSGASLRADPAGGFAVGWNVAGAPAALRQYDAAGQPESGAETLATSELRDLWFRPDGSLVPVLDHAILNNRGFYFNDPAPEIFLLGNGLAMVSETREAPADFRGYYPYQAGWLVRTATLDAALSPPGTGRAADFAVGSELDRAVNLGFVPLANGHVMAIWQTLQSPALTENPQWQFHTAEYRINTVPEGEITVSGPAVAGQTVTADLSGLGDADGLGAFALEWRLDGTAVGGATGPAFAVTETMIGRQLSLWVTWTDGGGTQEQAEFRFGTAVTGTRPPVLGTAAPDFLAGPEWASEIRGFGGDDTILAGGGDDTVYGGDGTDRLNLGAGNDLAYGGDSAADLRDVVFAGAGNDTVNGGHGNDQIWGDAGDDLLLGGFGADELIGRAGKDMLVGEQGSDLLYGGDAADFLNGGFGHDRLNGGAGADSFFHAGVAGHGSDWIQDYSAAQGDRLLFADNEALASQFQVNFATTPGAGSAAVAEAFVIYKPTGQILWALVDGAAQHQIWLAIDGELNRLL